MERHALRYWGLSLALVLPMTALAQNIIRTNVPVPKGNDVQWRSTEPSVGNWTNQGAPSACTNWTPTPDTVGLAIPFTQHADDCEQLQTRAVQERETSGSTGAIRDVGAARTESRIVSGAMTRNAVGTMESWLVADAAYSTWVNTGDVYGCSTWLPAPATKPVGSEFTQTANDCKQNQTREKQNREQETHTLAYKNVGAPVIEHQVLSNQTLARQSIGTLESWGTATPTYTTWLNTGEIYGCSTWLPAPTTKPIGTPFAQTANDCKQDQTRERQNREQEGVTLAYRNIGTPIVETQVLNNQVLTRQAVGTQENWTAITPIYSEWANTGALAGCSAWTPSAASVATNSTFTQSAGNCSQAQSRTRQDREQEATTLVVRNVGSPVSEARTLSNQTAYRAYTVSFSAWTNTSGIYGCATWSPLTTAVQKATKYTQTSNDCNVDQNRTRNQSYVDHITGNTVTLAAQTESRTIAASSTRTATGTKVVPVCSYSYGGAVEGWRFFAQGNSIWTGTLHSSVPGMWFGQETLQVPFSNPAQYPANLAKVSATEFVYYGSEFQWRIYRGAFVGNVDGFVMYQVCIE